MYVCVCTMKTGTFIGAKQKAKSMEFYRDGLGSLTGCNTHATQSGGWCARDKDMHFNGKVRTFGLG